MRLVASCRIAVGAAAVVALLVGCTSKPESPRSVGADAAPASTTSSSGQSATPPAQPATSSARPTTPSVNPAAVRPTVAATVATGLKTPWGLAFLPDGSALVSERDTGQIKRIPPGGGVSAIGTVPGVKHGGEGGLLGLAVASTFAQDRWLYAYLTADDGNRVVRMKVAGDFRLGAPQPLLTGIPAGPIHNGGRLAFGPDGLLYVTTGDGSSRSRSQDKQSLAGKILRVTPDGKPAPGNPAGSPVWTYGHRNVQGVAWDSQGRMWADEFGQETWDELNLIKPGANYGWPIAEGKAGKAGLADPVVQWRPSEASPSGIAIAAGSVWVAALRGARLWQVPLTADGVGTPKQWFVGEFGRLRTVAAAPDGSLWLVTSNTDGRGSPRGGDDRIVRIVLSGG
ncbi:MAG TPA: PQQ-dependent sugar dehydrogenase [Acidothermaceae bacterium]